MVLQYKTTDHLYYKLLVYNEDNFRYVLEMYQFLGPKGP